MELTLKQEQGLKIAVERFQNGEKYTCIAGQAGTGKSTLIQYIISALNIDKSKVAYGAYTGKAASVLKQKGCSTAQTTHRLLYQSRLDKTGHYKHYPKKCLEGSPKVVVIDEISMLPKEMWELLCTHDVYIIACGDPFQLPPIDRQKDNHILDHPHIFLDEVMRQAQESEIIRLSMHIRNGNPLRTYHPENKEVMFVSQSQVNNDYSLLDWPDQIICATHAKRSILNQKLRAYYNRTEDLIVDGDKLLNLNNEWDILSNEEVPLTNGIIGSACNVLETEFFIPPYIYSKGRIPCYRLTVQTENEGKFNVLADKNCLSDIKGLPTLNRQQMGQYYSIYKDINLPVQLTYGYAITAWKAQGSEWGKVLVVEENFPREDRLRCIYTEVTRAVDKLVIAPL